MGFLVLATDYDGTLASKGCVKASTLDALRRFRDSGRKLVLVTGRLLPELMEVFPEHGLFDRIVAENGALLYEPSLRIKMPLAPNADERLIQALRARKVRSLSWGHT